MKHKLILYDVFSYSCMNCLRSSEYIKRIDKKYKKYGLETILIHPPEWSFEKKRKNIAAGLKQNNVDFPFIVDKERKIIAEFGINFWPTQILVNDGKVLYTHIGEGNYKELEDRIIEILQVTDAGRLFSKEPQYSKHPTVYCGKKKKGIIKSFKNNTAQEFDFGTIYTDTNWIQKEEYLHAVENNSLLSIITTGKVVNFVAGSLTKKPIKVVVQLNNKVIKKLVVNTPKLYKLLELQTDKPETVTLTTEKDLAVYSFSFQ